MPRTRPRVTPGIAFCSIGEAAELLGVNQETVRRAYARGELLGKRLGDRILISRHSLLQTQPAPGRGRTTRPGPRSRQRARRRVGGSGDRAIAVSQSLTFTVPGEAVPQGSAKAFLPKGWTRPIVTGDNPRTKPWRALVASAALDAQFDQGGWPTVSDQAIGVSVEFTFARPASVSARKRPYMTVRPDVDKCLRAILDSLTKILWRDDAQVVSVVVAKRYVPADEPAHTTIRVHELALPAVQPITKPKSAALPLEGESIRV